MESRKDSTGPPSYAESVQAHTKPPWTPSTFQSEPVVDHVHLIFENKIIPYVQEAILSNNLSTTLVLVPSNVNALRPAADVDSKKPLKGFPGEKLVGFPSTEDLILVRLSDPEDTLEFWRRPASKQRLARILHVYLVERGYYFREDLDDPQSFVRLTGITPDARAGWMTSNEPRLVHLEASINVSMHEVCLRVENEMGLYETKKGNALVVRVKIGGRDPLLV